jgi:hypothetical protein
MKYLFESPWKLKPKQKQDFQSLIAELSLQNQRFYYKYVTAMTFRIQLKHSNVTQICFHEDSILFYIFVCNYCKDKIDREFGSNSHQYESIKGNKKSLADAPCSLVRPLRDSALKDDLVHYIY